MARRLSVGLILAVSLDSITGALLRHVKNSSDSRRGGEYRGIVIVSVCCEDDDDDNNMVNFPVE